MLVWLAPDNQEEVLRLPPNAGRAPFSEGALRRITKTARWEEQRLHWQRLTGCSEPPADFHSNPQAEACQGRDLPTGQAVIL
jgi:hypothetical protein